MAVVITTGVSQRYDVVHRCLSLVQADQPGKLLYPLSESFLLKRNHRTTEKRTAEQNVFSKKSYDFDF